MCSFLASAKKSLIEGEHAARGKSRTPSEFSLKAFDFQGNPRLTGGDSGMGNEFWTHDSDLCLYCGGLGLYRQIGCKGQQKWKLHRFL